ncbi:Universal stress protein family protein [Marinomonas aquimarina]|uniref:Universal stress protein family protein n=1 Tax=Marinomonas aquimarina TaxID=295068 RepID=A0A1A8TRH0_9GAMM|nr:universal stress protein [Marinomonas aquimarina]SBS36126.1 Universal stress protein family protein [Marinomonas aquimarina]
MKNIVACIDGSPLTQPVIEASAWAAEKLASPLVLLHALEKQSNSEQDLSGTIGFGSREHLLTELTALDEQRAKVALEHGKVLLEYAEAYLEQRDLPLSKLQRHGDFVETLEAIQDDTRLFVVGKQGTKHSKQAVIGSNLENAARSLSQAIMVVSDEFKAPESFMVAYDGRETAIAALERIAQSPLLKDIPCHLVMVKRDVADQEDALEKARHKLNELGFQVESHLIEGETIQSALLNYQQKNQIDLIAMGAYAHSKVRQFFVGSNTTKMLTDCQVPVLILR